MLAATCRILTVKLARILSSSSSCPPPRPVNIILRSNPPSSQILKGLDVEFDNGEKYSYSAEFLRVHSPAANSSRKSASGEVKVVSGRRHVAIMSVEPVGNYGIRIAFDDLHNTGIYTWNFLHSLGELKFHRMRQYLQALKHQGLSRDPPRKKWMFLYSDNIFSGYVFLLHASNQWLSVFHISCGLYQDQVLEWLVFSMWWLHLRLWRGKPHIYKEIVSLCLCTNPKPLKMAVMNTLNDVFMNMPSLSKWKYMLAGFHTPLITTILCPLSVVACDGKAYV